MSESIAEPRWRRLPEERPQQILDAALSAFAERGLAGTTIERIARLAGLSKGTIYLYFPNKEELFREVIRTRVVSFIERGEAVMAETSDPARALELWMEGYWNYLRGPVFPAIHRLVTSEMNTFPDIAQFYVTEVIERVQRLVRAILERGMDAGTFRRMDPLVAARMLSSLFVMHALWFHQRNTFKSFASIPDDVLFAQVRDFFFAALRS